MPLSSPTLVPGEPETFLDREEQVQMVLEHLELLREDPRHFKVLEVLGLGGMGKTTLLKQVRKLAAEGRPSQRALLIPLHGEEVSGETAPLQVIRHELGFQCLLFDTALMTYWSMTAPHFDRVRSSPLAQALPVKALEVGGGLAGFPLPLGFALEAFAFARERVAMARRYEASEFELIDRLRDTPEDLRRLLPEFLATDILRASDDDMEIVILYDGYERQREATRDEGSPWLRSFIETLGRGVHVIGTREGLCWPGTTWGGVLAPLGIDEFPAESSNALIKARLGSIEPAVEARLLEAAHGVPFYLETVINTYELACARPGVELEELPTSPDDSVARLLEHLDRDHRRLAVALATIQVFDREAFENMAGALGVSALHLDDLVDRYFVEAISQGLYKTHDILTEFVRESIPERNAREEALVSATKDLLRRGASDMLDSAEQTLVVFGAIVSAWYSIDDPPRQSVETLVDACYLLYDAGYWNEVGSMPQGPPGRRDHPVSVAMELFAAVSSRRSQGVNRALELSQALRGRAAALGRHEQSADLEIAYLRELAGDYRQARVEFLEFERRIGRFDPTNRIHVRSRLYLADMQTMDGDLLKGSRLLLETSERLDRRSSVDWAELARHRGHAFRFSFLLDDAASRYREAMVEVAAAPALCAKLHTNLAEAYCWSDPEQALKQGDLSIELNHRFANRIELAKCDAARGIALARLREFDAAAVAIERAFDLSREIGYPAGTAFALQADAVAKGIARQDRGLANALERLRGVVSELGTYGHLLVAPLLLSGDSTAFAEAAAPVEWIEPEQLEQRLGACLGL